MPSPIGLVDKIKAFREQHGCSLHQAKRVVEREYLLESISEAKTFYELRDLVRALAERIL